MNGREIKTISNTLISSSGNKLQLAEITFDAKIQNIKPLTDKIFDWKDIDTIEKCNSILTPFVSNPGANDFLLAIPGGIDPHVHFSTPGFEFREDFEHASYAAAVGGTTTIIDMPCTSIPPVTSVKNMQAKLHALSGRSYIDFAFWGGISGCNFDESEVEKNIFELAEAGVAGFKAYMISGMESFGDLNFEQMKFVAKLIERTGKPMAVHAEDKQFVLNRQKELQLKNKNDWQAYCESRDVDAESFAVQKLISIGRKTSCKIHIVHLSSRGALDLIRNAQTEGIQITTETCPHYLYFTQKDFENQSIRNFLKTAPPVKFEEDKDALWKGLADGSILFVSTDHAGCNPFDEKSSPNFWEIYGGIPGVEHRVPFLFSEGFLKGKLSLEKTIQLLSSNIANYFGLKAKGFLKSGYDADFTLINLWDTNIVTSENMHSKGKYTPFEGVKFKATVKQTYIAGKKIESNKMTGYFLNAFKS
ncbi:MAG: amidohydrolase family protein [bacterium]